MANKILHHHIYFFGTCFIWNFFNFEVQSLGALYKPHTVTRNFHQLYIFATDGGFTNKLLIGWLCKKANFLLKELAFIWKRQYLTKLIWSLFSSCILPFDFLFLCDKPYDRLVAWTSFSASWKTLWVLQLSVSSIFASKIWALCESVVKNT